MTIDTNIGVAVRYETNQGEGFVYGGAVIGFVAGASLLFGAPIWLAVVALAGLGTAFYHAPMIKAGDPPLALLPDGLALGGFGILPWNKIKHMELRENWVRTLPNPELSIETDRPLPAALVPSASAGPLRRFQIRAAKPHHENRLSVPLQGLNQEAEHIHDAAQAYWMAHR